MNAKPCLDEYAVEQFEKDAKIGLIATVDAGGLPHLSLITSLQAKSCDKLMFGQFCEGWSKDQLQKNPRAAFCVMNQDKQLWRGRLRWTGKAKSGEDYELYNRKPMFRYNSYFGIHTVHYLDLVEAGGMETLKVAPIVAGAVLLSLIKRFSGVEGEAALRPWAEHLVGDKSTLKFLSWVGEDGFPVIVPVVPVTVAGARRLLFSPSVYAHELSLLQAGTPVAVFALNLQMESVLMRGAFSGYRRFLAVKAGVVDIDWVYNSMPPKHGPIYPPRKSTPVREF